MLEVIEDDEDVRQHQRHVRQADGIGVRIAERLDGPHEVIAEEPHGAAGEGRHLGPRRLAKGACLVGGELVRVGRIVAERPAHDLARSHADERVAPELLAALGGLQQERRELGLAAAELQERRDRRLGVVDEAVAQRDEVVVGGELAHLLEARLDGQRRGRRVRLPGRVVSGDGH